MQKIINLSLVLSFRNEEHSIKTFYNDIKKLLDENKILETLCRPKIIVNSGDFRLLS